MSLQLKTRRLQIERIAGEARDETVAGGTVHLPERYPSIHRVLQVTAHPIVNNVEPSEDRVLVEGVVRIELLYASQEQEQYSDEEGMQPQEQLHKVEWEKDISYAHMLEVHGATEESNAVAMATASTISPDVRTDNMSLDVDVVVDITVQLKETDEVNVTTHVAGQDAVGETEEVRVRAFAGEYRGSTHIRRVLSLSGRSVPEHVLDVTIHPTMAKIDVHDDYILVHGYLDCAALYIGSEGAGPQSVEWPNGIPFEIRIVADDSLDAGVVWETDLSVSTIDFYVEQDEDGSGIGIEADVSVEATAFRNELVPCVVDVSSSAAEDEEGYIATRVESYVLYEAIGEGSTRSEASGVLELSDENLPIERVLNGRAQLSLEEVHVLGDKVAIEGQLDVELLYVGRGENDSIVDTAQWKEAIAVDVEIPLPGAEPGLDRHVTATVRNVSFDLINRETVEVTVQTAFEARVGRTRQLDAVAEAVFVPTDDTNNATFTFVIVDENDTLWRLAQLYRTTEEELRKHNSWLADGEPLQKGNKLCIVHSHSEAM